MNGLATENSLAITFYWSVNSLNFLKNPDKLSLRNEVQQCLKSLTETYDYKSVLLIDTSGIARVAFSEFRYAGWRSSATYVTWNYRAT